MPKYLIYYSIDGAGRVTIEAASEEEAHQKFDDGDWTRQGSKEEEYNYELVSVEPWPRAIWKGE